MVNKSLIRESKKYMWDGREYSTKQTAEERMAKCMADGFEVLLHEQEGKFFIYTRRVVTNVVVEGAPA